MHKIFVYGTLRKGARAYDWYLSGEDTNYVGPAAIRGDLHDMGSYPAVINADEPRSEGIVLGDVFEVTDETLKHLDAYEGYPYLYQREVVNTRDGQEVQVYVYGDVEDAMRRPLVESGDWLDYDNSESWKGG